MYGVLPRTRMSACITKSISVSGVKLHFSYGIGCIPVRGCYIDMPAFMWCSVRSTQE